MFWACMSTPAGGEDPVYYIYLRGRERYATAIGNITCTVSPTRPAIFPVMYQSKADIFSTKELVGTSKPGNITSMIIMRALAQLGDIVLQSQSLQSNVVAESIIALGVQSLGLSPNKTSETYLQLYAAMIQGILVNQVGTEGKLSLFYLWSFRRSHTLGSYIRRSPTRRRLHLVCAQ